MKEEIEGELSRLLGLPVWSAGRSADLLQLQIGERFGVDGAAIGAFALHVACPWRLTNAERVLVGSGDLFTPSDAEAELETFDWDEPGANWLDLRLAELWDGAGTAPPEVIGVQADAFGGFRLALDQERLLEVFPNSTPTGHVSTEFWRLVSRRSTPPEFAVGTFGIIRE